MQVNINSDSGSDTQNPNDQDTSGGPIQPVMPEDTRVGIKPVGGVAVVLILGYMLALSVVLVYTLVAFFVPHTAGMNDVSNIAYFGVKMSFTVTNATFMLAIFSGALGGSAYALKSFCWYVGNRTLHWSWVPRYLVSPFQGAVMGFVFHIIINSGLQGGQSNQSAPNSMITMAIGMLVGLFSEQALEKLHQVATAFFADTPVGRDRMSHSTSPGAPPAVAVPPTVIGAIPVKVDSNGQAPNSHPLSHTSRHRDPDTPSGGDNGQTVEAQVVQAVVTVKSDASSDRSAEQVSSEGSRE